MSGAGKKKWSKGKTKEKVDSVVFVSAADREKLIKDILSIKAITVGTIADKTRLNGSVARKLFAGLLAEDKIERVSTSTLLSVYTAKKVAAR